MSFLASYWWLFLLASAICALVAGLRFIQSIGKGFGAAKMLSSEKPTISLGKVGRGFLHDWKMTFVLAAAGTVCGVLFVVGVIAALIG